jgi:hypothetical protein
VSLWVRQARFNAAARLAQACDLMVQLEACETATGRVYVRDADRAAVISARRDWERVRPDRVAQ